jgi:hypothetical protein
MDGYYKDIELYGNEPIIIMLEELNRKKKKHAVNNSKCQK